MADVVDCSPAHVPQDSSPKSGILDSLSRHNLETSDQRPSIRGPHFQGFPLNIEPPSYSASMPVRASRKEYFEHTTEKLVRKFIFDCLKRRGIRCPVATPDEDLAKPPKVPTANPPSRNGAIVSVSPPSTSHGFSRIFQSKTVTKPSLRNLDEMNEALLYLADEFEVQWERYQHVLSANWLDGGNMAEMKDRFFTTSENLHFPYMGDQGKKDGELVTAPITWGKIVAHFCFTAHLACEAARSGNDQLVNALVEWFTQFVTLYLRKWIERNGGWVSGGPL